jgi:hypothetical protein
MAATLFELLDMARQASLSQFDGALVVIRQDLEERWVLTIDTKSAESLQRRFSANCATFAEALEALVLWTRGVIIL